MTDLLSYQHFHLIGIKGVAMTALAQILVDAGKNVTGTDVTQDFVTKKILAELGIKVSYDFAADFPKETEVVIYTAAHGGPSNPMVLKTKQAGLVVISHAEALAYFFNLKAGIAVCGVGGKSTTSAMISFIFEKIKPQSFAVGVGDISGLGKTGQWLADSQYFVAEADEYVVDPSAPARGEKIIPRFSFLRPAVAACTNLDFDHPDVYRDFDHTKEVYLSFFHQLKQGGVLVVNGDDRDLLALAKKSGRTYLTFGESKGCDLTLLAYEVKSGQTVSKISFENKEYTLNLIVPGKYNVMNALAALLAAYKSGVSLETSIKSLADFSSTRRRFEFLGEKNGVKYYDDYAHHPDEILSVIGAFNDWCPDSHKVIAFQSHTYSRTKELFFQFADSFRHAEKLVMIDIFPSAREKIDPTITSDLLCAEINRRYPNLKAENLKTNENLAQYFKTLPTGTAVLTIGAGDIYEVHDLVQ